MCLWVTVKINVAQRVIKSPYIYIYMSSLTTYIYGYGYGYVYVCVKPADRRPEVDAMNRGALWVL